jgi:hypothetical protein
MFQAQISGRGQIQYIQQPEQSKRWVDEWKEATNQNSPQFSHEVKTKEYKITEDKNIYKLCYTKNNLYLAVGIR